MSVFRIEKNKNYTVMSNYHLRDKNLSLKAKGLLSQMLSLPEDWDYTLRGLAAINKESVDAIRTAVLELEQAGYISRRQTRDSRGRMSASEYTIYETPHESSSESDKPVPPKPIRQKSTSENPTEINKEISNIDKQNKEVLNTQSNLIRENLIDAIDAYTKLIKRNIDYDILCESHSKSKIDEIVDLIAETVCTARKRIRVAGEDYPADAVRSRLLKLDSSHIEYVLECLRGNTTQVHNIRQYTLTALFNAPTTMNRYYSAKVNHDLYGGHDEQV